MDSFSSVHFCSVAQSCPTLCDPMNRSTPGLPVHHQLPEFTQTHVHGVGDAIQPSHPLSSPSPPDPQSLPASESFPMSQLFAWGGQRTGVSASASFLPKKSQGWSPDYMIANISHVFLFFFPQVLDKDVQKPLWQTETIRPSQYQTLAGIKRDWGYRVS